MTLTFKSLLASAIIDTAQVSVGQFGEDGNLYVAEATMSQLHIMTIAQHLAAVINHVSFSIRLIIIH